MAKDYYKTLGVGKNATKEDIKKAWKQLAKKYHPDANKSPDASDKFKEINEAASVLGDEKKRSHYDNYGTAEPGASGGYSGFDTSDMGGFDDLDDIFERFFGGAFGGRRRTRKNRGSDLRFDLEITLEEAAFGTTKKITIPKLVKCEKCNGLGAESEKDIETCDACNGSGMVRKVQRTPFGLFQTTVHCNKCNGQGRYFKKTCHECDGTGVINAKKTLDIKIPGGVDNDSRLRVSGEGEAGEHGGPAGDLYIVIQVTAHKIFQRQGDDIFLEIPISFHQACIGDDVEVPTLKGKATLKIPSGTQSETTFRIKGKGIKSLYGHGTGDQNIKVTVEVPKTLTKKQKDLLGEFDKEFGKKKSIFEKLKIF